MSEDFLGHSDASALIAFMVRATGLSATEIARTSGLSPSTLTRLYPEPSVSYTLSRRSLLKMRDAFPALFKAPTTAPSLRERTSSFSTQPPRGDIPLHTFTVIHDAPDVAGVSADFEFMTADLAAPPVGFLPASALPLDPGRFLACYMPSDVMEPRFRAGEQLIVDRLKPAALAADVLVQIRSDGAPLFCIGRLVNRDRNVATLKQHLYGSEATFHRSQILSLNPIVAVQDKAL